MNSENKLDDGCYRCCTTQSEEAVEWLSYCLVDFVPTLTSITETISTVDGVSDAPVSMFLLNAVHNICAFHVINFDIFKCFKANHYDLVEQLWHFLWYKVVHGDL